MITKHDSFKAPPNPNIPLWRYLDLPKFLDLIQKQALFFPRSDRLGDPYEGTFTSANHELWDAAVNDEELRKKVHGPDVDSTLAESWGDEFRHHAAQSRQNMYISCWHASEHESAAMWSQYAQAGQAIAVQTTFETLATALPQCVMMGVVHYLDYNREIINWGNLFHLFLTKRRSFEHEKEVRAIMWKPAAENADEFPGLKFGDAGASVPVKLTDFVEKIYVGPHAPAWFVEVITNVVERYGLKVPVCQSDLMSPPVR